MSLKIEVTPERGKELILAAGRLTEERDAARLHAKNLHREQQSREGKLISAAVKKERDFWLHTAWASFSPARQEQVDDRLRDLYAQIESRETALRAIIERASPEFDGPRDDIRRLAAEALGEG